MKFLVALLLFVSLSYAVTPTGETLNTTLPFTTRMVTVRVCSTETKYIAFPLNEICGSNSPTRLQVFWSRYRGDSASINHNTSIDSCNIRVIAYRANLASRDTAYLKDTLIIADSAGAAKSVVDFTGTSKGVKDTTLDVWNFSKHTYRIPTCLVPTATPGSPDTVYEFRQVPYQSLVFAVTGWAYNRSAKYDSVNKVWGGGSMFKVGICIEAGNGYWGMQEVR